MLRYSHLALLFTCFLAMVSGLSFSARPAQASLGVSHAPSTGLDAALAGSLVPPTQVPDQTQVAASLGRAPVMFIENVGQFDSDARFQVRGGNGSIYLADDAIWFTLLERPNVHPARRRQPSTLNRFHTRSEDKPRKGENLKLSFVGANAHPTLEPFNRLDAHVSYFIGSDRSKWHANVPVWGGVRYKDLYPGIDLEITSENGHIVQRVVARGGADLNAVRLRVDGADKMTLDADRLRVTTAVGEYTVPLLQVTGAGSAKLPRPAIAENQVSSPFGNPQFAAAGPQMGASDLLYSTYLGGDYDDDGIDIAVDSSGAAYVTGLAGFSDFPTTPGAFDTSFNGGYLDAFVVKLNGAGSALIYATFLGGSGDDYGLGIGVDSSGAAYVTGLTYSPDFPTTPGAFDTTCGSDGSCNFDGTYQSDDTFVVKLNRTGSALASGTFLGGHDSEVGYGIALDSGGSAYVTGETWSSDFPTTPGAFDTTFGGGDEYDYYGDAFVLKLAIPTTAIENDDPSIQYNGWRGVSDPNSNGGTYRVSNVKNDQVTFKFKGTSIKWLTFKGPDQGQAQVTIDSIDRGTVKLYSPTPQWNVQQTYNTYSGLLNMNYTISIKVLGTKNPSATDYSVVVDGFILGATSSLSERNC